MIKSITMKKIILVIILLIISFSLTAQTNLNTFKPISEFSPDLSAKTENEINRQTELSNKAPLTLSEKKELDILLEKYGEVIESVWNITEGGCSWYCGGGNYKVNSSSELNPQGTNNYSSKSANDLNYKTAWIVSGKNAGINEYIEYHFKNKSPRITSIVVSNGYMKSDSAWKNNNRVKSLKLYVNNVEYGILELTNSKTDQEFKIGPFGHNTDGTDLVFKFEILSIHKGDKYNDTAITEIYFNGFSSEVH